MRRRIIGLTLALALCLALVLPAIAAEATTRTISGLLWGTEETAPAATVTNVISVEDTYGGVAAWGGNIRTVTAIAPVVVTVLPDAVYIDDFDVTFRVFYMHEKVPNEWGDYDRDLTRMPVATRGDVNREMVSNWYGSDDFPYEPHDFGWWIDFGMHWCDWSEEYIQGGTLHTPADTTFVLEEGEYHINWGGSGWGGTFNLVVLADDDTPPPPPPPPPHVPNLDTASPWAHEGITRAFDLGLIPAELQGLYTQATTRAEFTALAVALYETVTGREITGRVEFVDTNDVNVRKMAYLGVVLGVGDNRFDPNARLTREQAAVMLYRLANAIGQPFENAAPSFADNANISAWAVDGVGKMQAAGIMGGVGDNRFDPQGASAREQSIITILRLFDRLD